MTPFLRRYGAVLVLAPFLALAVAAPALAESTGSIDHVEVTDGEVQILYSVTDLPEDVTPDPDSVSATVNDKDVEAVATNVAGDPGSITRTAVLAIDVSKSMEGERFEAAKQAALAYVDAAPSDVNVALVAFANEVETVEAPTQDKAALVAAIGSLELTKETHLYDGILQALNVAGENGARTILVLSDGADTSTTPLSTVTQAASNAGVRIDVVALNQEISEGSPLARISEASNGQVASVSNLDELEALFIKEANALAKQLLVSFPVPDGLVVDEGNVAVSVEAGGTSYTAEAFVSLDDGATSDAGSRSGPNYETVDKASLGISKPVVLVAIGLTFVGFGGLLAFGMTKMLPAPSTPMQQQLSLYTADGMRGSKRPTAPEAGAQIKDSAVRLAEGIVSQRDFEANLSAKLDRAGMSFKAAEWLLLHAGIAIGLGLGTFVLTSGNLLFAGIGFAVGAVFPWLYLSFKASRRIKNFNGALAQTLQIIAGALQAGLSLPQAVDTVVQEGDEVVASEFKRAMIEQRLGVDIEDSLDSVADRMGSNDFKWVVMAVRIQREVGGNLAELLLTVAATLREREYLRRQVQVLSAEGRMSAYILGGLPPFFTMYLLMVQPNYLDPMIHTTMGLMMLGVATVMMVVGMFWMKKTVKVEV